MLLRSVVWPAVFLPLLVAAAIAWLDPAVRRDPAGPDPGAARTTPRSPWSGALAFAAAYLAAHTAIAGWPPLPAVESSDWLAWLVVAAALGGIVVHTGALRLADPVLAALLWTGLSATTLRPMLAHTWNRTQGAVALGILAFAFTVTWLTAVRLLAAHAGAIQTDLTRSLRPASALVLAASLGSAGIALGLSATARLGMIAGAAAVVALALAATTTVFRGALLPGLAAVPPITTALIGLLANGMLYAELPGLAAAALIAAPLGGLVALRAAGLAGWRRTLAAVVATVAVAALALGVAGWQSTERNRGVEAYDPYA
ncbi:MAG TPA: hypothetical protein VMT85_11050 [Thermoanaerobaculia bacterium]|nr:hypothetical protein [Thermoanaerobaculia bacterium]